MADNAKPDDQGLPNKSAHPGFNWNASRTKLGVGDDEWDLESSTAMVPPKDRADRLYSDIPYVIMAS